MRFIHAADLHIDSPLRGLAAYPGAPVAELRQASRGAFANLVRDALAEQVELVVLAGDVFDGDWPDYNTGLFFINQLTELTRAGIKVVVLAGNHDAASQLTRRLALPYGAVMLSHDQCQTVTPDELGLDVAVHGQSYAQRAVVHDLSRNYPAPIGGVLNIGLLHTALDGRPGHDSYAPCTLRSLREKGYDYWALGHIHEREVLHTDPWIVFPGNLQGRHARETGAKGYSLVTTAGSSIVGVEARPADVARWVYCEIDASDAVRAHDIEELAHAALQRAAEGANGRLLAVRVVIAGATDAHDELVRDRERFDNQVRARSFEIGDLWIEQIQIRTRRTVDLATLRDRDDAVGTLLSTIHELRRHPDELVSRYQDQFQKLRDKLPAALLGDHDDSVDPARADVQLRALDIAEAHLAAALTERATS